MKLNDWIREQRKKKNFTVTQLADAAGISHAQVSRIENDKSEISLITLVRLFYALDIPFLSIFDNEELKMGILGLGLSKPDIYHKKYTGRTASFEYPCINFNDIGLLDTQGLISSGKIAEITYSLLQQFLRKFEEMEPYNEKQIKRVADILYSSLGDRDKSPYLPPLSLPFPLPKPLDFCYPKEFSSENLRKIYLSGGCLISLDVGMFAHRGRMTEGLSLRVLAGHLDISHQGVKLLETRTAEKLIFDKLVELDQSLNLGGNLIVFAWRATEIYTGAFRIKSSRDKKLYPFSSDEIRNIEKLIVVSRYYQHFLPEDVSWLEWFRKISLSGVPVDG
jgi:transcriptional regulator with XRE-family HTH domain